MYKRKITIFECSYNFYIIVVKEVDISLTIIVPFFNEEKYLKKSVDRLLKLNCYEKIILFDDCLQIYIK